MKAIIELYRKRDIGRIESGVIFEIDSDISVNKTNKEIIEYVVEWRKEKEWIPNKGKLKDTVDFHGEYEIKGGILDEEGYKEIIKGYREEEGGYVDIRINGKVERIKVERVVIK